ncbi:centromere protein J isoform X2 [Patella vulgata]|uniref:centromere protein J isoform X2 n=1 Tax=Patella vulgata TaxID=6465 RepID=UPI0024A95246|nr:centromere protein J isoform X2 [Patella vulgata]
MEDPEEDSGHKVSHNTDTTAHDTSLDILEQQQAREQARLLNRFRELRTWQQQQQEQLMMQQQVQLEILREEQLRVQNMLKSQRQQQWGAGRVKIGTCTYPGLSKSPTKTSPTSKQHGGVSNLVSTMVPHQMGSQQNALPKPVIYDDPTELEGDNYTNPDLFSNPGSSDQLEDGVYNAYDTGSEISDPSSAQKLTLQTLLRSASPETLKAMLSMIPRSRLLESNAELSPRGKIIEAVNGISPRSKARDKHLGMSPKVREITLSPRARLNKSPSPRSSGSVIVELERRGLPVNGSGDQNGQYVKEPFLQEWDKKLDTMDPKLPQDVKRHLFCDEDNYSVDSEIVGALEKMNNNHRSNSKQASQGTSVQPHKSDSPDEKVDDETSADNFDQTKLDFVIDDRPIKPGLAGKKTFEQLLEEQLKAEEVKILAEEADVVESPKDKKKPFLKRGQGLARFTSSKSARETKKLNKPETKPKQPESKLKQPESKPKQPETKPKQAEKPAAKDGKRKYEPPNGPLSNTAKSNQVSKPACLKSKSNQSVPKTVSSQSTNPLVPSQTLKLNPSKVFPKPQSSSSKPVIPQTSNAASSVQPTLNAAHDSSDPRSQSNTALFKVPVIPAQNKEVTSSDNKLVDFDPFDDDSSFAAGVRERIANEGKEQEELDEFELLEDFADNASFCSNSSIVSKLLQADQKKQSGEPLIGLKTILEARKQQIENAKPPEEPKVIVEEKDDTLVEENVGELSSDTLTDSDSSISSDSELNEADIKFLTAKLMQKQNGPFVDSNGYSSTKSDEITNSDSNVNPIQSKSLTRKIASRDGFSSSTNASVSSSTADMRSLLQRLTASKGPHINTLLQKESSQSVPEGGKQFVSSDYEDGEREKEKESSEDESEESTSEESDDEKKDDNKEEYVNDFDDEEEWIENAPKAKNKASENNKENGVSSTPPTSRLVARLFPSLNQEPADKLKKQQEAEKLQATKTTDGIQSKILRDKLAELEKEIERFRNENAVLDKLRKEREEGLSKLKKEILDFEKEKSDELSRLEEFKNQEMKKLKHERKMFEKYQKTIRSMPDKKDRDEIDMLKNQLNELQEEMKRKEGRWTASQSRFKDKLELVELENKELKEEIKLLEKKRIEWMQKEATSQKIQVNGHQSYPRSSTPTQETEQEKPNVNNNHISPPRSQPPPQKKGIINQMKFHTASKSLSLTTDSIPNLQFSTTDPQPRVQPTKITKSVDSTVSTSSSTSNLSRKLATKVLSDHPTIDKGNKQFEESQHVDGKIERIYKNGAREILFANGTRKEISSDGQSIVVAFFNGDIKQIFPDKRVVYYYADAQTSHTTYPDSLEVLQFQNGQIEKHYPDGTKEITFPDQTVKYLFPNGSEESIFPDGTVIRVDTNGDKTMEFPNGQREIHNSQFKRREYPDGTVKTVYPDGRQETRYSTGRIRLKDKDGNVIMDRIC